MHPWIPVHIPNIGCSYIPNIRYPYILHIGYPYTPDITKPYAPNLGYPCIFNIGHSRSAILVILDDIFKHFFCFRKHECIIDKCEVI